MGVLLILLHNSPFFTIPANVGDTRYSHFFVASGPAVDHWPPHIGMSFLLRFPAVCFSWREAILHLGKLGPCSAGAPSTDWYFGPQLTLTSTVSEEHGLLAMIDTGFSHSTCPKSFFHLGMRTYALHGGTVEVTCEYDDVFMALVGMDTLLRFSAFGWRRDPLRVVFVP